MYSVDRAQYGFTPLPNSGPVSIEGKSSHGGMLGAGCLVMVVLAHLCEALDLFPWMQWASEHSAEHYLDLGSALLGLTLFPVGYLLHALTKRHA
jgi:hypothetical protein